MLGSLCALISQLAPAATEIFRAEADALFRASHTIAQPASSDRVAFETSGDLHRWERALLTYDAAAGKWSLPVGSAVTLREQVEMVAGVWKLVFELPLQEDTFTRLVPSTGPLPVDATVTAETRHLLQNLHRIGWDPDKIVFGQEFPLSYSAGSNTGNADLEKSDVKDVVGQHPGVHGVDFHYMIDRPWEEEFHKAAACKAYEDGAIVTIDFHWPGKYGKSFYVEDPRDLEILDNVVNGDDSNGDVTWFYESLDRILTIINDDLRFPFVFRPLHENNGDWFWWGSRLKGGSETYKQAYRLLVDYMSARSEYALFCWSPDKGLPLECYPGDDYVDVIGIDLYGAGTVSWLSINQMVDLVEETVDFARGRGKVAAITETGFASQSGNAIYYDSHPDWWMTNHLNPILSSETARQVAWALTWINASWSGPYIPHAGAPEAAKEDFLAYFNHPVTLFQNEVAALNVYDPPPQDD